MVAGGLLLMVGVNAAPLLVLVAGPPLLLAAIFVYFAPDAIAYTRSGRFVPAT